MSDETIPARAVTALLREILAALDDRGMIHPARAVHVVSALRQLLRGPQIAEGDVAEVTAILAAYIAEAAPAAPPATAGTPEWDPQNGPYASRAEAEAAYADFTRGAESSTLASRGRFLGDALVDVIDEFGSTGAYDRDLIGRLADLLTAVDMGVICSWIRRAAHDRPEAGQ